jgi:hypothetical protein
MSGAPAPADGGAPMLTRAQLDAMAVAIGSDILTPYIPPARPFLVGGQESIGIRDDYRVRTLEGIEPGDVRPDAAPAALRHLASRIADAISGSLRVVDTLPIAEPTPTAGDSPVVLFADLLQRLPDPAQALEALGRSWRTAAVLIVSTPLRALTTGPDDLGPPENPAFSRQWTFPELQAGLDAWGFEPLFGGVLHAHLDIGVVVASARTPAAGRWRTP